MDTRNGRNRGNKNILISFAANAFLLISTIASAEIVRIDITAIVDNVVDSGNYLEGRIHQGSLISGYYIYDSAASDAYPLDPTGAVYFYSTPPNGVFLNSEGFIFQTDLSNVEFRLTIANDNENGGLHDLYGFGSNNNLPLSNGASVDHIGWQLFDPSYDALTSDLLPITPPILTDWPNSPNKIFRIDGERGGYIIDSHVISAVPEPMTICLLGFGLLFLRKRK